MILGALYVVLTCATLKLWAQSNPPTQFLNIWRFLLVEVATIGILVNSHQSWHIYWIVFAILGIFSAAHMFLFVSANRQFGWFYIIVTALSLAGPYWMFAWFMHGDIRLVAPLSILVPCMFFTYTPLGRRAWAKYVEAERYN